MSEDVLGATEFEELFRRTAPKVHAYLGRRAGDAAPDLLSEVYLIAWTKREALPEEELRLAWLIGIARRLLLSHYRRERRHSTAEREAARVPAPETNSADTARHDTVREALGALKEVDRELIQLTEWEGLSVVEAALAVGLKEGNARVRLFRARRRLAEDPTMKSLVARTRADPAASAEPLGPRELRSRAF